MNTDTKSHDILVSVVTICYNSEKVIEKTIEAMTKQTYPHVEYIIIDGASKDRTVEIASGYKEAFEKKGYSYKIISEPDHGIYDAMNKGIRNSTGEIIGIINSGDFYQPDAIETVVKTYLEEPFDYFDGYTVGFNEETMVFSEKHKHTRMDRFPTSRHWSHPSSFVTKQLYDELGLFRCKGLYDDFDFYLRVRRANKKIVFRDVHIANFARGGISQKKSFRLYKRRMKDRYNCYRDNGYSRLYGIECLAVETAKMILPRK